MANEFEEGLKDLVSEQFSEGQVAPLRNETTGKVIGSDGKDIADENANEAGEAADEEVGEREEAAEEENEVVEGDDDEEEAEEGDEEAEEVDDKKPLSQAAKLTRALRETRKEIAEMKRERAAEKAAAQAAAATPKKADGTAYTSADEFAKDKLAADPKAPKKPNAAAKGDDGQPVYKLGEFDDAYKEAYDDYLDARRDYLASAKDEFKKGTTSASDAAPEAAQKEFTTKLDTTVANGKKLFKDFDEKVVKGIEKDAWALSETGAHFLVDSEVGPEMAYHLASNPKLAKEIAELPPMRQAVRLGKLEEQISAKKADDAKKAKRGSSAPTPLQARARGGGGRETGRFDGEDFEAVERNWEQGQKRKR